MTIRIGAGRFFDSKRMVRKFADKSLKRAENVMRWTQIFLFTDVIISSPVDTGRFRANWYATIDTPSGQTTTSTKRNSLTAMKKEVKNAAPFSNMMLTNNLEYAMQLENGHSGQAPMGMARLAIRRAPMHLRNAVRKVK